MNQVYPSIEELMPEVLLSRIPATLAREVKTRYETLGTKYLTNEIHNDGRRINAMMFTSRIANCIEEVVDAVFCILGEMFRQGEQEQEPQDYLFDVLMGLIEIFSILKAHEEIDLAANEGRVNLA